MVSHADRLRWADVCFWHLADIDGQEDHVRYWG